MGSALAALGTPHSTARSGCNVRVDTSLPRLTYMYTQKLTQIMPKFFYIFIIDLPNSTTQIKHILSIGMMDCKSNY